MRPDRLVEVEQSTVSALAAGLEYPGKGQQRTAAGPTRQGRGGAFTGWNRRDGDAGTALRRGKRGRSLRCPGRPRAERTLHASDRRTSPGRGLGPDLPARAVRDRSGEPVATQGDPGTNPRRGNGRGDRGRGRHRGRARALVRGTGAGRTRLRGRPGAERVGAP